MPDSYLYQAKLFLVDDHPAIRQGLSLLLHQEGIAVCGEADSVSDTLKALEVNRADLVIVDLSLGNESGLELLRKLMDIKVTTLVYSMYDDAKHIEAAFAAGAKGYVTKRETATTLLAGIRDVLAGNRYFSPVVAKNLADKVISSDHHVPLERLSDRELEIFCRTGEGYSAAEMAEFFSISPRTIESYYARIIEKMSLSGVKAMRRLAIQHVKKQR